MTAQVRSCEQCGGAIPYSLRRGTRFCGTACAKASHRTPKAAGCFTCGGPMTERQGGARFCSVECKNTHHNARQDHHLRLYGIPRVEVMRMVEQQGGCAICATKTGTDWVVDHDHACCPRTRTCGKCVRGVVCRKCNSGLGMFGDDPNRLLAAAAYLLSTRDLLAEVGA